MLPWKHASASVREDPKIERYRNALKVWSRRASWSRRDGIVAIFGSSGEGNMAIRKYLNDRHLLQLFVLGPPNVFEYSRRTHGSVEVTCSGVTPTSRILAPAEALVTTGPAWRIRIRCPCSCQRCPYSLSLAWVWGCFGSWAAASSDADVRVYLALFGVR